MTRIRRPELCICGHSRREHDFDEHGPCAVGWLEGDSRPRCLCEQFRYDFDQESVA